MLMRLSPHQPTRFAALRWQKAIKNKYPPTINMKAIMSIKLETKSKRNSKGGRPQLTDDEYRSTSIRIGLNKSELAKFSQRCALVGMESNKITQSNFARKLLINERIYATSQINRDALVQLGKIGNNLNQITKVLNTQTVVDNKLTSEVEQIMTDIRQIATEMVGNND
jgi:Bacterial mobilisation protein (MobC)